MFQWGASNGPPKYKMIIFLKDSSNEFYKISLSYGDHFHTLHRLYLQEYNSMRIMDPSVKHPSIFSKLALPGRWISLSFGIQQPAKANN
jgi:hypothetical protein